MSKRDFESERERAQLIAGAHYNPRLTQEEALVELAERFGPQSVGWHELWDRIHVQQEMWETHVASHPATTLEPKTYELSQKISDLLAQLYLHVGSKFPD